MFHSCQQILKITSNQMVINELYTFKNKQINISFYKLKDLVKIIDEEIEIHEPVKKLKHGAGKYEDLFVLPMNIQDIAKKENCQNIIEDLLKNYPTQILILCCDLGVLKYIYIF
eukprot:gene6539-10545_t